MKRSYIPIASIVLVWLCGLVFLHPVFGDDAVDLFLWVNPDGTEFSKALRTIVPSQRTKVVAADLISNPYCGQYLTTDVLLESDLDCSQEDIGSVFSIDGSDVVIDCNGHKLIAPENAVAVISGGAVDRFGILNCECVGAATGISLDSVQGAVIRQNIIHGVAERGIVVSGGRDLEIKDNHLFTESNAPAGIELFASEGLVVAGNTVHGFRLGGIQFYGTGHSFVHDNLVYRIGDTCFGFFSEVESGEVTRDLSLWNNEAYECGNVGANEIMFGSRDLFFFNNYFHDSQSAFSIYDPSGQKVNNLVIAENLIADCFFGLSAYDQTESLFIHENHFIGNRLVFDLVDANNISICRNLVQMIHPDASAEERVMFLRNTDSLQFNQNIIFDYSYFVESHQGSNLDLRENYWNGCPPLSGFSFSQSQFLDLINPIDLDPSTDSWIPYSLTDENLDGFDDENCELDGQADEDEEDDAGTTHKGDSSHPCGN